MPKSFSWEITVTMYREASVTVKLEMDAAADSLPSSSEDTPNPSVMEAGLDDERINRQRAVDHVVYFKFSLAPEEDIVQAMPH